MEEKRKHKSDALASFRQLADQINDGFADIMEKTQTQMEELDPLEAHIKHREIFQKNLKSHQASEQSLPCSLEDDNDSGVEESSSGNSKVFVIVGSGKVCFK